MGMRAVYVPLEDTTLALLIEAARRERRHPKDQAAVILERVLVADARDPTAPGVTAAAPVGAALAPPEAGRGR
jgi:hypothetical protein